MVFCGVKIDEVNLSQAKEKVGYFLNSHKQYKIFTPNPEIIVNAQKYKQFKDILNKSDLNICDGFGLSLFSNCPRIPGIDFMLEICKIAAKKNIEIYLLGSDNDKIIKQTMDNLQKQIPNLKIAGYNKGLKINIKPQNTDSIYNNIEYDEFENEKVIENINNTNANILFVAFGMIKQEEWIYENLKKIPKIKVAMGVGGSFDYISGIVHRAPCFLRKIGLEWLYRLLIQPKRLKRIFNATVIFTLLALKDKFFKEI